MPRGKEWQKKPQQLLLFGQQMRYRYSDTKKVYIYQSEMKH